MQNVSDCGRHTVSSDLAVKFFVHQHVNLDQHHPKMFVEDATMFVIIKVNRGAAKEPHQARNSLRAIQNGSWVTETMSYCAKIFRWFG